MSADDATTDLDTLAGEIDADVDADVQAVFEDVQQALADLADLEIDVSEPADLERARRRLPTDPTRAELVAAALPPALGAALEYVHPSDRQAGYWRRSRERRDPSALSDAELVQRHQFVQAAKDVREAEGTVRTRDGREIPVSARKVGDSLRGESFDPDRDGDGTDVDEADHAKGLGILARIRERI